MEKKNKIWSIRDLQKNPKMIEYAEYQREPTVWDLDRKQRLIDSVLRNIDIASIYLYKSVESPGSYECIDGRQRINAILSFLGLNETDEDDEDAGRVNNYFRFSSSDELYGGKNKQLGGYEGKTWKQLSESQRKVILDYDFNVIEVSNVSVPEDLNLMFLRLQLGTPLNAGEKLRAMKGDMRDLIYDELGKHDYFRFLQVPQRRYSKEITAAQVAINYFSLKQENSGFTRARFVDIQEFFRRYYEFTKADRAVATSLKARLTEVFKIIEPSRVHIKSRAMGVSIFFFMCHLIDRGRTNEMKKFLLFLKSFLTTLSAQVKRGIDIEPKYRDMLKFQTNITQAAVERSSFTNRQSFLEEYFDHYVATGQIKEF